MVWNKSSSVKANGGRCARCATIGAAVVSIAPLGMGWTVVTAEQESRAANQHQQSRAMSREQSHDNTSAVARETIRAAVPLSAPELPQTNSESVACVPHWDNAVGQPGMDNSVWEMIQFDDGSGPALYAAGQFTTAGGAVVNNIAKWDGQQWTSLGGGTNDGVGALAVFDDGTGPALYAGGRFTMAGGVSANRIAKWDGREWSAVGEGVNDWIYTLTVHDDGMGQALYAGGRFTTAGGQNANNIAKWDGTAWFPLGAGMGGDGSLGWVFALQSFDDGTGPKLYAGGPFTAPAGYVATWNGEVWSNMGWTTPGPVHTFTVVETGQMKSLIAGGSDWNGGFVVHWNGEAWLALGGGLDGAVEALAEFDDGEGPALYAGGWFAQSGRTVLNGIAKWNPGDSRWSPLAEGVSGSAAAVFAIAVYDGQAVSKDALIMYVGGAFTTAGVTPANRITAWHRCSANCALADLTCDGVVNGFDLVELLSQWGPCSNCGNCPADLTGDCAVNGFDLVILLSNWG